jgi:hypothetical protein
LTLTKRQSEGRKTTANSRFAKAGVSCFYESEVLNSSFLHLMKFSAKSPPWQSAKTLATISTQPTSKKKLYLVRYWCIFTPKY